MHNPIDTVQLDVPLFIRLLELAREEVDNDADLHLVAEIVTKLSTKGVVNMDSYPEILAFMNRGNGNEEISHLKRLSGLG